MISHGLFVIMKNEIYVLIHPKTGLKWTKIRLNPPKFMYNEKYKGLFLVILKVVKTILK